jgi:phosphate-selective porin OprO/OprP
MHTARRSTRLRLIGQWTVAGVAAATLVLALVVATRAQEPLPDSTEIATTAPPDSSALESSDSLDYGALDSTVETDEFVRLRARIEQLESAEKKRAAAEKKKSADEQKKKDDEAKKADDWQDMSTDKWTVKLGGHVQLDYVNWAQASDTIVGDQDYTEFRRVRLVADGTGYGVYDFRLQMTLEPESVAEQISATPEVKDAYLSLNEIPGLGRFRIGNFFVPFSLEQVTNDTNNVFLERSIPTQGIYAADREVGVALYNSTEDRRLTWTTGMFFDSVTESIKERIDDNQGYRLSGRVTGLPYYDEPSNGRYLVHVGAGILHTQDQDNRVRFRARPQVREGPRLIDSGVLDADSYTTGNLEFAGVCGPLTLQSEVFLSTVARNTAGAATTNGAYAHLSWFLTGENRIFEPFGQHGAQFARNVPYSNFFLVPGGVGTGAVELKTRMSWLDLRELDRGTYHDVTVGVNWYWSDRVRVMFDYIHPMTSQNTTFGSTNSDLLALRFDFNW